MLVPPDIWRLRPQIQTPLLKVGKQAGQSLMAAGVPGLLPSCLFYVTDCSNGFCFLIDTGAEVSVIPPSSPDRKHRWGNFSLQAVNDTPIATCGNWLLTINIGLRWNFQWIFMVADVKQPILGADVLWHYNLLVDTAWQMLWHNSMCKELSLLTLHPALLCCPDRPWYSAFQK